MEKVGVEVYCNECEHEDRYEDECEAEWKKYGTTHRCSKCGSENVYRSHFVVCHCGTTVYLSGDTQCDGCGQWYNAFGQELKDPEFWEENY